MYIKTTVFERDISNEIIDSFREGVKALALDIVSIYGYDPFKENEGISLSETISKLDFDKDITLELELDDAGFTIYKMENYEKCYAWSNKSGNYDGVAQLLQQ